MIQQVLDDQALLEMFYEISGKDERGNNKKEDDAALV